ncbi:hypothetical protein GCM10028813_26420 [Ramlibacter alkalitolerans]
MTVTEFLQSIGFRPYGSVVNSWDSFNEAGSVMMQLWQEPNQRVRDHAIPGAYLRVRCFHAQGYAETGADRPVGYAGRAKAISALEDGAKGYAALSSPPEGKRGAGVWAKYADLSRVYPILAVERTAAAGDIFVILGAPIPVSAIQ